MHRPPCPTPFPYTTLFRSRRDSDAQPEQDLDGALGDLDVRLRGVQERAQHLARAIALGPREEVVPVVDDAQVSHRRSEEHTSELQSQSNLVCRLLLEKKNT